MHTKAGPAASDRAQPQPRSPRPPHAPLRPASALSDTPGAASSVPLLEKLSPIFVSHFWGALQFSAVLRPDRIAPHAATVLGPALSWRDCPPFQPKRLPDQLLSPGIGACQMIAVPRHSLMKGPRSLILLSSCFCKKNTGGGYPCRVASGRCAKHIGG